MAEGHSRKEASSALGGQVRAEDQHWQVPNQWAQVQWTRRQSPEWKPRRASVAACQLHHHHHQQQQYPLRRGDTRRDSLHSPPDYLTASASNLTLRKFLSQRLAKTNNLEAQSSAATVGRLEIEWQRHLEKASNYILKQQHETRSCLAQKRLSGDSYLASLHNATLPGNPALQESAERGVTADIGQPAASGSSRLNRSSPPPPPPLPALPLRQPLDSDHSNQDFSADANDQDDDDEDYEATQTTALTHTPQQQQASTTCCATPLRNELQAEHLQLVLGMDEKLQLQGEQRKFLMLSMALKRMILSEKERPKSCVSLAKTNVASPGRTHLRRQRQRQHQYQYQYQYQHQHQHQYQHQHQHQHQKHQDSPAASARSVSASSPLIHEHQPAAAMSSPSQQPKLGSQEAGCFAPKRRHLSFCATNCHEHELHQRLLKQPEAASSYCTSPRSSSSLTDEDEDRKQPEEPVPDLEALIVESWLDDNPSFVHDYFMRKASSQLVDDWLIAHAKVTNTNLNASPPDSSALLSPVQLTPPSCPSRAAEQPQESRCFLSTRSASGASTPVRKISATDFESRSGSGFLRPMVSTTPDGRPTFLARQVAAKCEELDSAGSASPERSAADDDCRTSTMERLDSADEDEGRAKAEREGEKAACASRASSRRDDEMKLIFELVKNICNDLDIRTLLHKILRNIAVLINADKSSLFLVNGTPGDPNRHLVSQLFNVDQDSELNASGGPSSQVPICIPWGTGLVGYVAESGEALNIANCYEDPRFTDTVDQRTGYVTRHMLCAPILDKRNEIVGVAQVINKRDGKPFTKDDEVRFKRYLQFCGIGLRNAQSYEHCQLENRRNQVLLDLARMVFEEQSTIEQVVYRIMLHTQSLLDCERCQVLLIDDGSDELDQLLQLPHCSNNYNFHLQQRPQNSGSNDQSSAKPPVEWRPQCVSAAAAAAAGCASGASSAQVTQASRPQTSAAPQQQHNEQATKMDLQPSSKLFSLVFDLECEASDHLVVTHSKADGAASDADNLSAGNSSPGAAQVKKARRQFPINIGITGYVAMTGETLNIEDAHKCHRFDASVDDGSNFRHKSILCMPIRNGQRRIIGVSQLINKKNGRPFNKNDEDLFEAFAIFCGLGIHNTLMYERVLKIMAKQRVTFEVLSYHATAPLEEARKLNEEKIPSCFALNLTSLKFNDFSLDEQFMLKACLRFFLDLDLIRRFQIDRLVFCNWILSVQKNYRKVTYHPIVGGTGLKASPVRYHNWRHAFNVSQMMFAILINTQICQSLGELETLALLIACLCHDLDHRGTNNSFQIKSASPLAELYSTSTMEHHHFDQCVMILNSQGNQILANLSPDEYSRVIMLLKEAILATDLANYFQKRELFFKLINGNQLDWQHNPEHRSLLRCMLMTACDVAAITKPWSVQKVVADLVRSEFYQQGDLEKEEFNIEPIDMMNRDKMSKLPEMQIGFIDSICAPIYTAFARLFPVELTQLLDGCIANRDLWAEAVAREAENGEEAPESGGTATTTTATATAIATANEPATTTTTVTQAELKQPNASSPVQCDLYQSCDLDNQLLYSDCSLRSSCSLITNEPTNGSHLGRPILTGCELQFLPKVDGQRKSV